MAKKNHLDPASLVIARFGGIRQLAGRLGIEPSSVLRWRERGIVPSSRMADILAVARDEGLNITAEELILGGEAE